MLHRWSNLVDVNTSRYLQFAFSLNTKEIKDIRMMNKIKVSNNLIKDYLPEVKINESTESTELETLKLLEIKVTIVKISNMLEEIAISYKHRVADREIIEEAFQDFLINKDNGILSGCIKFMKEYSHGSAVVLKDFESLLTKPKFRNVTA